jgi:dTDP-4-dehydrorhamnose reductase
MILVFGSHGQVGQALIEQLGEIPEHVFLYRESRDYCGDLNDTAGITETLMELRPDIIINAAAYTAVDRAESEPELAEKINAKAPAAIAQVAAKLGSLLIHYSTDYVFNGSGSTPWKETDVCTPLSVYGHSKRAGEEAILAAGGRHYILRTSWVYGRHGKNFLKTMLQLADAQSSINVVNDQWGVPTSADYLAEVTLALIDRSTAGLGAELNTPLAFGLYHCAPAGETTWFDYARLAINHAKACGAAQACTTINPIPTAAYPTAAQRPLNSRLDTRKLSAALGYTAPDWQEGVIQTVGELLNQPQE